MWNCIVGRVLFLVFWSVVLPYLQCHLPITIPFLLACHTLLQATTCINLTWTTHFFPYIRVPHALLFSGDEGTVIFKLSETICPPMQYHIPKIGIPAVRKSNTSGQWINPVVYALMCTFYVLWCLKCWWPIVAFLMQPQFKLQSAVFNYIVRGLRYR
jgi:hypothetical protein